MTERVFFAAENTKALGFAAAELEKLGFHVTDTPSNEVTHLLLAAPSAISAPALSAVLDAVPKSVTVIGGKLDRPELDQYRRFDLLKNELYLAKNAAITASSAVTIAASTLPVSLEGCPVLVLGWGRIGKCLAQLLKAMGALVCVAARKETDRAMLSALGYDTEDIAALDYILRRYRVIFNTVPAPVLSDRQAKHCRGDCLKIELASSPGIGGDGVIAARGLPGKYLPESSGKLIARTILKFCAQEEGML